MAKLRKKYLGAVEKFRSDKNYFLTRLN